MFYSSIYNDAISLGREKESRHHHNLGFLKTVGFLFFFINIPILLFWANFYLHGVYALHAFTFFYSYTTYFPKVFRKLWLKKHCAATTFSVSLSVTKQRTSFFCSINLRHFISIKMKWIFAKVKLQYMTGKTCQNQLKLLGLYRKVTHTTYCSQVLCVKPNPINVSPVIYTRRVPVM